MAKDELKLGRCPACDANMDLVGRAHNCRPRVAKKLPPMVHPEGEPIVAGRIDWDDVPAPEVTATLPPRPPKAKMRGKAVVIADKKPAAESLKQHVEEIKKRGRPAKRTPEERKAYRAELMRKKRAK
jgi:hypothetical protein